MKSITQMQGVELIKNRMGEIPRFKIYYTLRIMKAKPIRDETVDTMRACLAIHQMGLPITTDMLGATMGKTKGPRRYNLSSRLHLLGDKNALVLRRGQRGRELSWHVSPTFLSYYGGDFDE